jgi:hypothetical protein
MPHQPDLPCLSESIKPTNPEQQLSEPHMSSKGKISTAINGCRTDIN